MRSSSCDSCEIAWADLVAQADDDTAAHVAEAFAVVGLAPGSVLEPLDGSSGGDDELVLANVCLVAKGEAVPEGHEVLTETLCGQKASINNAGATLHLAVRRLPRREVIRPITAIAIVDAEHPHGGGGGGGGGEDARVPAGFEALDRTAHGERCQTSKLICISRQPPSPCEPSAEAAPLAAVRWCVRAGTLASRRFRRVGSSWIARSVRAWAAAARATCACAVHAHAASCRRHSKPPSSRPLSTVSGPPQPAAAVAAVAAASAAGTVVGAMATGRRPPSRPIGPLLSRRRSLTFACRWALGC